MDDAKKFQERKPLSDWNQCKIDAAVEAFIESRGSQKDAKKFRDELTKRVAAHPDWQVTDMANEAFAKIVPDKSNYQRVTNVGVEGNLQDANLASGDTFNNKLREKIETCRPSKGG